MDAYRPFIDDPRFAAEFEGQRFIVVRATGGVAGAFHAIGHALRARFAGVSMSYIAQPHLTFCGFARGTALEPIRQLAEAWAAQVPPLAIDLEGVDCFPDPSRVVVARIRRTPVLEHALSSARRLSDERGPRGTSDVPVDAWVFHLSIAYCAALTVGEWEDVGRFVRTLTVPAVACRADAAEIVAFDDGREYQSGTYRLSGGELQPAG
jgi:2'-5' RNA ligase